MEYSEIDLDPELLSITRDVEKKARGITPDFVGGPKAVKIKVKWRPHPMDQDGESGTWVFDMNRVCLYASLSFRYLTTLSLA